jgi:hypothetical protein
MKLRRLMQLPVEDKAYQRAALCVTAKLARQVQRWVNRYRCNPSRGPVYVRFTPNSDKTFAPQRNVALCH